MTTITVSTSTDPNGTPKTHVLLAGQPILHMTGHDDATLRNAWSTATTYFDNRRRATLRRWDGDNKLLHTVASK